MYTCQSVEYYICCSYIHYAFTQHLSYHIHTYTYTMYSVYVQLCMYAVHYSEVQLGLVEVQPWPSGDLLLDEPLRQKMNR